MQSAAGLVPVRMAQSAAPERIIGCNCGGNCDKKICTCRRNGLLCIATCGQCRGITD